MRTGPIETIHADELAKTYVIYAASNVDVAFIAESPTDRMGLVRRGEDPCWLSADDIWRYPTLTPAGDALILSSEVGSWDDEAVDAPPNFELEYYDPATPEPLWQVALTGEIDVATSTRSREFYLTGQGPVQRFNERGSDGHLDPSIAAVAFSAGGQLVHLDQSGHLH